MSAWAIGIFLLTMIVIPLIVNEAGELARWLAGRMVQRGASLLGTREARERYTEEWAANLERVPGKLAKLAWACGLLLWSVPRMRIQIQGRERGPSKGQSAAAAAHGPLRFRRGEFLVTLAGARPEILKECEPERAKFQSMAWAMLITTVMASDSMWLGLTSGLGINGIPAVPIAALWALTVLSIDRMMIISVRASDGARRFTIMAAHLLFAIMLGFVISTSVVLRIFQPEISSGLSVVSGHKNASLMARLHLLSSLSGKSSSLRDAGFLLAILLRQL